MNATARRLSVAAAVLLAGGVAVALAAPRLRPASRRAVWVDAFVAGYQPNGKARSLTGEQCAAVLARARTLVSPEISYDASYVAMGFPMGDVPATTGVCADVVVRALRAAPLDLQEAVHRDFRAAPEAYPRLWGSSQPDPHIDHRRVPNLMAYFSRHVAQLPLSREAGDYRPCDVVAWDLGRGVTHIGLVGDRRDGGSGRPLVLHHLGGHPTEEDVLFDWRLIGHFGP